MMSGVEFDVVLIWFCADLILCCKLLGSDSSYTSWDLDVLHWKSSFLFSLLEDEQGLSMREFDTLYFI